MFIFVAMSLVLGANVAAGTIILWVVSNPGIAAWNFGVAAFLLPFCMLRAVLLANKDK